jgi:stage II sporulation protein D
MFQGWISAILFLTLSQGALANTKKFDRQKNDEIIRVRLGEFEKFKLMGYELTVNGRARLADQRKIDVRCSDNVNREEVSLGDLGSFPSPIRIAASGGFTFVNDIPYRSTIIIHNREGKCLVVNELGVEKYIAGVINTAMQANWPIEALKTQAVTARSYAINAIEERPDALFHVHSDTSDQMYRGAANETVKSNLATTSTRGTVLYFTGGVLKAYYHANCGGRTDVPESVWGNKENGAYRSVYCPYHRTSESAKNWNIRIEKPQLEAALRKMDGDLPGGLTRIASLTMGAASPGMRQKSVILGDSNGKNVEIDANSFRQMIGYTRLKSTKFQVRSEAGALQFQGVGYGHGVGMCQIGAREMALRGKSHIEILKHYYPLARLANLY